jgi:hypothetical protein
LPLATVTGGELGGASRWRRVVRGDREAAGQEFAGVVEEDDAVA